MKYEDLTKAQRWYIADRLAEERLPSINKDLKDVIPSRTLYVRYGKRFVDIIVSGTALIVTLPINVLLLVGTYLDVGCPVLFKQERIGKDGKNFELIKFRNMTNERDERGELLPPQKRVTKWGSFVRKTSLDELLNFWSVFKGDMSIIGPRPLVPEYKNRYNKRHRMRFAVRPGLECPPRWKLDHVWTWEEQFENDVWYVENVSLKTDLFLFLNLIRFALDKKSTQARAHGGDRGIFVGYDLHGQAIIYQDLSEDELDRLLGVSGTDG